MNPWRRETDLERVSRTQRRQCVFGVRRQSEASTALLKREGVGLVLGLSVAPKAVSSLRFATALQRIALVIAFAFLLNSRAAEPLFKVIAFYTGRSDQAHISFVREANQWFPKMAQTHEFAYEATTNWSRLNKENLSHYQVVLFLDTRPENAEQRTAFEQYMEQGGGWMGFHFAGFALTPSACPQNWDWYHEQFLGSGEYVSNTWRPTGAILRVEETNHPAVSGLPQTFKSSPNEWYRWKNDLRTNPKIRILLSIDPTSFPLGTGPKPHEIWHSGYYPVVWSNTKYRMLYLNMGHNDIDYEHKTNKELSLTFGNEVQDRLVLQGLMWLGGARQK